MARPLRFIPALILACVFPVAFPARADDYIITDGGREVILKDDGSWEFASDDLFATDPQGHRIRLKADGSWESIDQGAAPRAITYSPPDAETPALEFSIDGLIIETRNAPLNRSKNARRRQQMVVTIDVRAGTALQSLLDISLIRETFSVSDSGGNEYEILDISPATVSLSPGERKQFSIRLNDAPSWRLGRQLKVEIRGVGTAIARDIALSIPLGRARDVEVDGFQFE